MQYVVKVKTLLKEALEVKEKALKTAEGAPEVEVQLATVVLNAVIEAHKETSASYIIMTQEEYNEYVKARDEILKDS